MCVVEYVYSCSLYCLQVPSCYGSAGVTVVDADCAQTRWCDSSEEDSGKAVANRLGLADFEVVVGLCGASEATMLYDSEFKVRRSRSREPWFDIGWNGLGDTVDHDDCRP